MKSCVKICRLALLTLVIGSAVSRGAEPEPNVIFILGDDQAWWDYSFMARTNVEHAAISLNPAIHRVAETPAIDRLADEGLTFTHGYTTPLCRPSLASIFTGTYPHQHYVTGNDLAGRPPDEAVEYRMQVMQTLPRILATRLGYPSFQTGKWWEGHYSNGGFTVGDTVNSVSTSNPDTRPLQWSSGKPSYVTARHGDWGLMIGRVDYVNDVAAPPHPIPYANTIVPVTDFIDAQVAAGRPFFIAYNPFLPHTPHDPPAGLLSKYDALVAENNESGNPIAEYYANIERFDGGVGAILDHLDAAGITDNTMVMLICDNGWITTDSGTYAPKSKRSPYEGGVRTPIIVRWPNRIKSGGALEPQVITDPVSLVDLVPTVLHAVGLEPSPEMTGVNLLDLGAVTARDTIFGEDNHIEIQDLPDPSQSLEARFAIRDGWKLILFADATSELYWLYDSVTGAPIDPFETNDLSAGNPILVSNLTAAIETWYEEPGSIAVETGTSQAGASNLLPAPAELGQTFTATKDQDLVAIRVGLHPTSTLQTITLELRELDGAGAPLGNVLSSATVLPGQLVPDETRWYLFALDASVALTSGTNLGFLVASSAGPGAFEAAYRDPGSYAPGQMYYSGLIDGYAWTSGVLDLAFETLYTGHDGQTEIHIEPQGGLASLYGEMGFKQLPVMLQSSTNLEIWLDEAVHDNLDGLTSWTVPMDLPRQYFRIRAETVGAELTILPTTPGTFYGEDFSGTGVNLHGATSTVGGVAWTAPAPLVLLDDGSLPGAAGGTAYLPFSPEDGWIYTLTVEIEQSAVDVDGWVAFGFLKDPPGTAAPHQGPGVIWALTRNFSGSENQVLHENLNGGTGSIERGDYVIGAATVTMSLVLDTTGGSGNWNYDWIVNGTARVTDRALSTAFETAIGGVGIGKHASLSSNRFTSFTLDRTTP